MLTSNKLKLILPLIAISTLLQFSSTAQAQTPIVIPFSYLEMEFSDLGQDEADSAARAFAEGKLAALIALIESHGGEITDINKAIDQVVDRGQHAEHGFWAEYRLAGTIEIHNQGDFLAFIFWLLSLAT